MFRNPSTDLIVVLVIVLLIFGPKNLPKLGRQLGHGMREFKDSITGDSKDSDAADRPELTQSTSSPSGIPAQPAAEPQSVEVPSSERRS